LKLKVDFGRLYALLSEGHLVGGTVDMRIEVLDDNGKSMGMAQAEARGKIGTPQQPNYGFIKDYELQPVEQVQLTPDDTSTAEGFRDEPKTESKPAKKGKPS
jgi:hypothetical protein